MGEYMWLTFKDVDRTAASFGKGLRTLGQKAKQPVVIFAETRAEWMIAAHACFKQNIPVVTIYATLGEEAIAHGINETEVSMVITSHDLLSKFHNILPNTPKVKTIVYMEDQLKKTDTSGFDGIQIIPFKEVISRGAASDIGEYYIKFLLDKNLIDFCRFQFRKYRPRPISLSSCTRADRPEFRKASFSPMRT